MKVDVKMCVEDGSRSACLKDSLSHSQTLDVFARQ